MGKIGGTILLLLGAMAWIVAAMAAAILATAVLSLGPGLLQLLGVKDVTGPPPLVNLLCVAFAFQGTMLLGALWQGRRPGDDRSGTGLGTGPVRNWRVVLFLCGLMLAWLVVLLWLTATFAFIRALAKSSTSELLNGLAQAGPEIVIPGIFLVAILALLSEELFFRGWLWEALRRRGNGIVGIAATTTIPWLLLHGIDSPGRILILMPAALIIVAARWWGGGVRASLLVHLTNNAAAVLMELVASLAK